MYNIEEKEWTNCPDLKYAYINHSSVCVNGKVYLFYGQSKTYEDELYNWAPSDSIERLDVEAHIEGQSVEWEGVVIPPEQLMLIKCPLMAPISDTEIAFLRFGLPDNFK